MVVDLVKKPRLTLKGRRTSSFSFAFQSCSELQEELNAVGYAEEPDLLGSAQPCGYFYVHLCVLPLVRLRQQQMANVPPKNVPLKKCPLSPRRSLWSKLPTVIAEEQEEQLSCPMQVFISKVRIYLPMYFIENRSSCGNAYRHSQIGKEMKADYDYLCLLQNPFAIHIGEVGWRGRFNLHRLPRPSNGVADVVVDVCRASCRWNRAPQIWPIH